uniref:LuxE/PaaK family acyltransferase n=1 Tax=Flavobacterium sp. TaxID=239 RepID=UPI00404AC093
MLYSSEIFSITSQKEFHKIALKVFRYQFENNLVYKEFCVHLNKNPGNVKKILDIPFLPIQFFKSHQVVSTNHSNPTIFTSSGTTGSQTSRHFVADINLYEESYRKGFAYFYGAIQNYTLLALLPSYLERAGSSLIYMVEDLIKQTEKKASGFYLHNYEALIQQLKQLEHEGENTLLIGVTYALLDLIETLDFPLKNTIVMETGGMKGKRKEMIREELHAVFTKGFGISQIHSEYGMTELLSQAYSFGDGIFECPPWMQVYMRDTEDALTWVANEKTGGINVIDLANLHSCSFIATQDLGKKYDNQSFEVLGRFDNSDIRGCNLMVL